MTITLSPGPEAVALKSSKSVVVSSVDNTRRPLNADGAAVSVRSPLVATPGVTSTSTVPVVKLEALKQLAELRKTDVAGQKDAYKND